MLNLTNSPDLPTIGLETHGTPEGYLYISNNVYMNDADMAEILKRIKVIDDNTKDPKQTVLDYLENGTTIISAHFPPIEDNKNKEDFSINYSLSVQYPSYIHDDGSVEWDNTNVPLEEGELSKIEEVLSKSVNCKGSFEMAEKVNEVIKQNFTRPIYDLQPNTMTVYNTMAENTDGFSHIHCDFYMSNQAALELLFKTDYLKDHTDYYTGKFKSIRRYEENIDVNVRFQFGANLFEDGKAELIIRQYDIKSRGKWEIENGRAARTEDLPKFYKEIMVLPLNEREITAIKTSVNRYFERIPLSLKVDDMMQQIVKSNNKTRVKSAESPINEDMKTDRPYIVREGERNFIEIPLSFSNSEFDKLLKRQPLTYEDGTVICSTSELKPDTWIWAFAQIEKSNKVTIEMQIDGEVQAQGKPETLMLTDKETKSLINAVDKKCREDGYSIEYLKSQMEHSAKHKSKKFERK